MTAGVDVESIITAALRANDGVAALVSDRVWTDIPEKPVYPFARIIRIGGSIDYIGHLDAARIQFEAFARDRVTALDLAREMLGAMLPFRSATADGVVTGTAPLIGITYIPDSPTGYPRYLFDLQVFAHPSPV